MSTPGTPLVLVLGTADWDAVVATNQHQVSRALAERWPVLFAEGTGTRALRIADAGRVLRRLRRGTGRGVVRGTGQDDDGSPRRPVPAGVEVRGPRLVPHHAPLTHALNTRLLTRQLATWVQHPGPRVLWTYTPFSYGLQELADVSVYHLVDLLHENPGVHPGRLLAAETVLARHTDLALATSPAIEDHLSRQGFTHHRCLANVARVDVFDDAVRRRTAPRAPVVVFAGTLAAHKVDLALLTDLAVALRGRARLRLVGPVGAGTTHDPGWAPLLAAGAEVVAPMPLAALAVELAGAVVGVVPYRDTELTRGISPLKTVEYLAAGLSVVSTALPAVRPVPGAVFVEERHRFVARVLEQLATADPQRCREVAVGQDWSQRGRELRELTAALLAAR